MIASRYLLQMGNSLQNGDLQGTGDGQFNFPTDVAVDPKTNHVYVTDRLNNRIQVFAPSTNASK